MTLNRNLQYFCSKLKHYYHQQILLILRGGAARLIASLYARFDVCGVLKPGSNTGSLIETAKYDVEKLTMNDFLIICSGTNDIDRNYPTKAFKNITNFIKNVNHTNIILVSVPYRYDAKEYTYVNSTIKSFNNKLLKFTKLFSHVSTVAVVNNRLLSMDCIVMNQVKNYYQIN